MLIKRRTLLLLSAAGFLVSLHLVNAVLGWPSPFLKYLFDMERKTAIQSWFSAVVWFLAAQTAWQSMGREKKKKEKQLWTGASALFLLFSADEIAMLHERLEVALYQFLDKHHAVMIGGQSVWPVLLAPLALLVLGGLIYWFQICIRRSPGAGPLVAGGMCLFFAGAFGLDVLGNYIKNGCLMQVEVIFEEAAEMSGAILILSGLWQDAVFNQKNKKGRTLKKSLGE